MLQSFRSEIPKSTYQQDSQQASGGEYDFLLFPASGGGYVHSFLHGGFFHFQSQLCSIFKVLFLPDFGFPYHISSDSDSPAFSSSYKQL